MSIKKLSIFYILFLLIIVNSCSKEISITTFEDDYDKYESEKRIEAVVNTTNLEKSVVRIDNTMLVTDETYFDEEDNDGDWEPYEDLNGNGQWDKTEPLNDDIGVGENEKGKGNGKPDKGEPHVDEIDEIIPQLHDSTYTVQLYNKTDARLVADFTWTNQADQFEYIANPKKNEEEIITYGGYVPEILYTDKFDYNKEYEFIITKDDNIISGNFQAQEPVQFFLDNHQINNDTLIIKRKSSNHIFWQSGPKSNVYWAKTEKICANGISDIIESQPMAGIEQTVEGNWICMEFASEHPPGLYKLTVYVPSKNYGKYFYSSLPIRDENLNNFRDQDNAVVLGIAGAMATNSLYFRVIE